MDNRPIGIFDSGVGGLSVFKEIKKLLPKESYIFVADQKNVPYGEKSKDQLCKLSDKITQYLLKIDVKMIVVACNTATCYAIDFLRKKYPNTPFVGTVPAIKTAVELSHRKSIAVMSTPATSKSRYLKNLINSYVSGTKIVNVGCTNLENLVENGSINSPEVTVLIKKYLKQALVHNPDYIVLGCTHYPFLKTTFQRLSRLETIDSGYAIAKRVVSLLSNRSNSKEPSATYLTTGDPEKFAKVASRLIKTRVTARKLII